MMIPIVATASEAKDNFVSFTQIPQTESGTSPSGIYGWKNLFYPKQSGFSWRATDETTNITQFKIYIPAGTKFSTTGGYLPQQTQYAIVTRINETPLRKEGLSQNEYFSYHGVPSDPNTMFDRMMRGDEVISVHDGGGAKSLSGVIRLSTPLKNGLWIYGRVLSRKPDFKKLGCSYSFLGGLINLSKKSKLFIYHLIK